MAWTLTASANAIQRAGIFANSALVADSGKLAIISDIAEGKIQGLTQRDWITGYSGIETELKKALSDATSAAAAIEIINYDLSSFNSIGEAETVLDVLNNSLQQQIAVLKQDITKLRSI
jgi:hypothetical protein